MLDNSRARSIVHLLILLKAHVITQIIKNTQEFTSLCTFVKVTLKATDGLTSAASKSQTDWALGENPTSRIKKLITELETSSDRIRLGEEPNLTIQLPQGDPKQRLRRKLEVFLARAKYTEELVRQAQGDVGGRCNEAKAELEEAVTGRKGPDLETQATAAAAALHNKARGTACKVAGATTDTNFAGTSLVADLMCLCAAETNSREKHICGFESHASGVWANAGTNSNAGEIWGKILDACKNREIQVEVTPQFLRIAITKFEGLLGAQAHKLTSNGNAGAWLLGYSMNAGSVTCDGQSSTNGICVDYKGSSDARGPIAWLGHIKNAITALENRDKNLQRVRKLQRQAEAILMSAEDALIEANISLGGKDMVPASEVTVPNSSNPTSRQNSVVQEPTTVSAAAITPLILPWTLLI
uniref:Variant surface glycoprotein YnAT 1.3 n=1 Tax=Trypanosoma congolense TaxID=5692 RepID=VSY3_TRYCO|nr:RecName: Full=Variant surface glycoprotein YnAT 1.3; Short=VSG; Flags: Precursor [Trypanosoma congolense]AAA30300.1 variant surface glycoprotein precursor [Trypanosoma congolense]